jgi:hypothetical protein
MKIEVQPERGKVKITHNLVTIWVTLAEAEAAAKDPKAAAAIAQRLERTKR